MKDRHPGCSNMRNSEWVEMKETDPDDFARAVTLDRQIRRADRKNKKGGIYLHRSRVPLDEANFKHIDEPLPISSMGNDVCFT